MYFSKQELNIPFNSLHVKCRFICILDLFSLRVVRIYMHGGGVTVAKPNETSG